MTTEAATGYWASNAKNHQFATVVIFNSAIVSTPVRRAALSLEELQKRGLPCPSGWCGVTGSTGGNDWIADVFQAMEMVR
jgi:hypothetical protein